MFSGISWRWLKCFSDNNTAGAASNISMMNSSESDLTEFMEKDGSIKPQKKKRKHKKRRRNIVEQVIFIQRAWRAYKKRLA